MSPPYDGVIMAEDLLETGKEGQVRIVEAAAPWQHIRPIGGDIVAGEMILPGHHKIRAIDVGVLLSAGITEIEVAVQPSVAIFPTGTEIIEPGRLLWRAVSLNRIPVCLRIWRGSKEQGLSVFR